jgi:hypothetical protein
MLRVFDNKALTTIFGHKREEVPREWGRFRNEELHVLYPTPHQILINRVMKSRKVRWPERVARTREKRNEYSVLVGKPERK